MKASAHARIADRDRTTIHEGRRHFADVLSCDAFTYEIILQTGSRRQAGRKCLREHAHVRTYALTDGRTTRKHNASWMDG